MCISRSPSTVEQMFHWLPLKRIDQHPNPPSGRTWRETQVEGVSPSARNTPFFFFYHMGKHINLCAWKPHYGIRLFWLETHDLFSYQCLKTGEVLANCTRGLHWFSAALCLFFHFYPPFLPHNFPDITSCKSCSSARHWGPLRVNVYNVHLAFGEISSIFKRKLFSLVYADVNFQ